MLRSKVEAQEKRGEGTKLRDEKRYALSLSRDRRRCGLAWLARVCGRWQRKTSQLRCPSRVCNLGRCDTLADAYERITQGS